NRGNPGPKFAAGAIARNAARAGDTKAYAQADAIRQALNPTRRVILMDERTQFVQEDSDIRSLGDLTRAGEAHFAIGYALLRPDLSKQIEGLGRIAETLAGVTDDAYDRFAFFDD